MFVQSDNRILIGGAFIGVNEDFRGGLARLNANGTTDTYFITGLDAQSSVQAIAVQSDGKILIGGFNLGELGNSIVFRLHPNGSLDTNVNSSLSSIITDIAIQADGKILVGGQNIIIRLNNDGTTDPNFNTGTGFGGGSEPETIILQPNGQILVGGQFRFYNGIARNQMARLDANGTLDPSFNVNLLINNPVNAIGLQRNGKIIIGGLLLSPRIGIARLFNGDANFLTTTFDYDGDNLTDLSIYRPSVGEWWYLRSSDGQNRAFQFGNSGDKIVPADYTGDGKADVAFFRPSTRFWFVLRSEDNSFYAAPFGATGDIPVAGDYDGDGEADFAVWRPTDRFWHLQRSQSGYTAIQFDLANDIPTPTAFLP